MRRTLVLSPPAGGVRSLPLGRLGELRAPLAAAAAYAVTARAGVLLQFPHIGIAPVRPAAGVAVAALLLLGWGRWPWLAAAAFATNLAGGLPFPVAAAIAAGSTGECVLAAVLLARAGLDPELARVRDVVLLAGVGGLLAPVVASSVATAGLWAAGVPIRGPLAVVWATRWLADGIGILVFASAGLALAAPPGARRTAPGDAEAVLLGIVTVVLAGLVFLHAAVSPSVLFPLAIWAGVRFEQRGAAGVTLAISLVAAFATVHGSGRFSVGTLPDRLIPLQLYTASCSVTAMTLAAAITARRRSDQRLRERTLELEASNQELEAFTYTVSHDLRAPLRAIHGHASILAEDEGGLLTGAGAERLATVTRSAEHMSRLIDSLLGLARLGTLRLAPRPVDPAAAARAAAEHLQLGLVEPPPDLVIDSMPHCRADPVLLEQVYENLIGNAVKFTRHRAQARIHVGWMPGRDEGGAAVYFVRDNGAGFDIRYAPRLFALFERLPQHSVVPGIGAGLAIVARIVERHGGRVWAEGAPGEGAAFHFTIGATEERR